MLCSLPDRGDVRHRLRLMGGVVSSVAESVAIEFDCDCSKGEVTFVLRYEGKYTALAAFMISTAIMSALPDVVKPVLERLDE